MYYDPAKEEGDRTPYHIAMTVLMRIGFGILASIGALIVTGILALTTDLSWRYPASCLGALFFFAVAFFATAAIADELDAQRRR